MENRFNLEKVVIGELILIDKQKQVDAIIELEKIKFDSPIYKSLFSTIREIVLQDKQVDLVSVYQTNQETPIDEINTLTSNIQNPEMIFYHIGLLKDREYKNNLLLVIDRNVNLIESGTSSIDFDEIKNGLISDLSALEKDGKSEFENISEYKKQIEIQLNSNKDIEGFSWGISDLDRWTSGIVLPRVYVIGGLKKSGKTRFLIHLIKSLLDKEVQTAFLSMEMPAYEVTKLLHASYTGLNDMRFRSASKLKGEELQAFRDVEINQKLFGLECKSGLKLEQILSRIRRYAKMGFKVIMIDYLQRISHDRNKQAQELEDISIKLADSARQNNVALILLSQLNALAEKEIPNMGSLKGSGGIGEAADVIFLFDNLYRRTKKEDDKNKIDIYIEQRHGDSGLAYLWSDLGSCRFGNLAEENVRQEYAKEEII